MNKNIFKEDTTRTTQVVNRVVQYKKTGIALAVIVACLFIGGGFIAIIIQDLKLYESMTTEEIKTVASYLYFCMYFSFGVIVIATVSCGIFSNRLFISNQDKVNLYELIKDNESVLELTKTLYKNQKFLTIRQYKNIKNYYNQQKIENDIKEIDQCVFG